MRKKQTAVTSGDTVFVFSTLAADVEYIEWLKTGNDLPARGRSVVIKGGAGVANDRIVTPMGVSTQIDAAHLPWLEENHLFALHKENGHIVVQAKAADPEKVAADMNLNDPSAPLTPSSYEGAGENVAKPKD